MVCLREIAENAADRLSITQPIRLRFDQSSKEVLRTGIVFPKGILGASAIEITFGPQVVVLGEETAFALLAHEFAHHRLGHVKPTVFRLAHLISRFPLTRFRNTLLKYFVGFFPSNCDEEIAADRYATKFCSVDDLSIALMLLDLSWEARDSIEKTGLLFGDSLENIFSEQQISQLRDHHNVFEAIKIAFAKFPNLIETASVLARRNQFDSPSHPSVLKRLNSLSSQWDELTNRIHYYVLSSLNAGFAIDALHMRSRTMDCNEGLGHAASTCAAITSRPR